MRTKHCLAFLAAFALIASTANAQETIDFESLSEGETVSEVFGDLGGGPVAVNGFNPRFGTGTNAAMIFDSDCSGGCSGGDPDLGSPNADFGGPGVGAGGAAGEPFEND